jgi:hypothetical protein
MSSGEADQATDSSRGFVVLTLAFQRDGRRWLGRCLEIGTSTYGRTLEQTHAELVELVELHLNALEDVGERERFFAEHSISLFTSVTIPTEVRPRVPLGGEYYLHPHQFPVNLAA